jgi:hypothetical protein
MSDVFVLRHEIEQGLDTHFSLIGVFSTEENARQVVTQLETEPQFSGHPGNFVIVAYTVDDTSWESGFARMRDMRGRR